jgi:hypothetical protein
MVGDVAGLVFVRDGKTRQRHNEERSASAMMRLSARRAGYGCERSLDRGNLGKIGWMYKPEEMLLTKNKGN